MTQCAAMAGIHDEIMAMPMSYNSLIGDMGSSLSGGQKQRILLARALSRIPASCSSTKARRIWTSRPKSQINTRLRQLPITRISIAHRPEITQGADSVLPDRPVPGGIRITITACLHRVHRLRAIRPTGAGRDTRPTSVALAGRRSARGPQSTSVGITRQIDGPYAQRLVPT